MALCIPVSPATCPNGYGSTKMGLAKDFAQSTTWQSSSTLSSLRICIRLYPGRNKSKQGRVVFQTFRTPHKFWWLTKSFFEKQAFHHWWIAGTGRNHRKKSNSKRLLLTAEGSPWCYKFERLYWRNRLIIQEEVLKFNPYRWCRDYCSHDRFYLRGYRHNCKFKVNNYEWRIRRHRKPIFYNWKRRPYIRK